MFCFSSFDGTLSLKCQLHSAAGKPEEKKEEVPKGSGIIFWLLSYSHCIDVSACLLWHSSIWRKQWKDEIENRLLKTEAVNNHSFKLPSKKLRTLYFEIIHKRFIVFKAIENTSCSIWVLQTANRKLMKLAAGKLFRVARLKADKRAGRRAVQNWLYRNFIHELQHEVIYIRKSFPWISDGLWLEHYCSGARSWICFR